MFVLNVLGRGDFVLANRIKNFFDNFVKRNQKSKNNIVEEIDIKEGDKISTFGYSVGDTVEIVGTGNGSSYGDSNTAYGIGWTRTILRIWEM